jgi:hypothetical protein
MVNLGLTLSANVGKLASSRVLYGCKPPNTACTRQVGFAPPKGVGSVLEQFPSNWRCLVPPQRQ